MSRVLKYFSKDSRVISDALIFPAAESLMIF